INPGTTSPLNPPWVNNMIQQQQSHPFGPFTTNYQIPGHWSFSEFTTNNFFTASDQTKYRLKEGCVGLAKTRLGLGNWAPNTDAVRDRDRHCFKTFKEAAAYYNG